MDILEGIVAGKRLEIARQREAVSMDTLLGFAERSFGGGGTTTTTRSMRRALEASRSGGIIAEFKRRSPSKGVLHPNAKVCDVVPAYERGGAAACSILTDAEFFGGSYEDLRMARDRVKLPLLRKDFIVDEYQLYQARILGADAVLLIAAVLTPEECERFSLLAHQLEMEVLLEIHCEEELVAFNSAVDMLGVNNRHLGSFHTDVERSFRLIESVKAHVAGRRGGDVPLFVSESGISDVGTVRALREAGFGGFLMGETFMRSESPGVALANFIGELLRCERDAAATTGSADTF
jgi:indole-3-glycerol phosphate synthase